MITGVMTLLMHGPDSIFTASEVPEGTYYFLLTINGAVDLTVPDYVAHISGFLILRR